MTDKVASPFFMSPATIAPTVLTLTDKTTFSLTYLVRDDITVTIEQRHNHKGGGYDEARAVFSHSAQSFHDVVLMIGDLLQIASICGHPQADELVQYFDSNAEFEPQKHGGGDFAPEDSWKEYKLRDCGWKTNLWVHDNAKLELEHKYGGKGEPWNKITLQIADILAVLPLFERDTTAQDDAVHAKKLIATEKVVLNLNWPGYGHYRCGTHGVFALPPTANTGKCPTASCTGHVVAITDPVTYAASH